MKRWSVIVTIYIIVSNINNVISQNITQTIAPDVSADNLSEYCWNKGGCNVIGNFIRKNIGLSIPVNINCLESNTTDGLNMDNRTKLYMSRFHSIEIISLNGCGVRNRERNFLGVEYIPDPKNVIQLTLEMFKIDGEIKNGTFREFRNVEMLIFNNNELLSGINRTTLSGLINVKKLVLKNNSLKSLDENALEDFSSNLDSLIIHEKTLHLNNISVLHNVTHLELSASTLNWPLLFVQSKSVEHLRIHNTNIFNLEEGPGPDFTRLNEMHLTLNNLTNIPNVSCPNLALLNISHNELQNIVIEKDHMANLKKLYMAHNGLTIIDEHLLSPFIQLEVFVASHNKISMIKRKAFNRNRHLRLIDISFNYLKVINLDPVIFLTSPHLQMMIDENPWSCVWVINFSANEPHVFTMKFLFTKYSDRVNMRGLKCQFYPSDELVLQHHYHLFEDTYVHHNHSTTMPMLPALPVEISRRNTKHTAIITIIILVVGVTSLLIILYFHLRCRPMATSLQPPFYRTLPNHSSSDRVDIVRRILPPTDYESPLSEKMKRSAESINDLKVDTTLFTDIDLKDLYEEIPEKHDVDDLAGNHFDLDDFTFRLTNTSHVVDV